jgi:hypothetical protein
MPKARGQAPKAAPLERRAVPGEFVFKLTPTARQQPSFLPQLLRDLPADASISTPVDRFGMAVVHFDPKLDVSDVLDNLRRHPAIEFIEPNFIDSGS